MCNSAVIFSGICQDDKLWTLEKKNTEEMNGNFKHTQKFTTLENFNVIKIKFSKLYFDFQITESTS